MRVLTTIATLVVLLSAVGCYALAATIAKSDPATHDGLLILAGGLGGWVVPRLQEWRSEAAPARSQENVVTEEIRR